MRKPTLSGHRSREREATVGGKGHGDSLIPPSITSHSGGSLSTYGGVICKTQEDQ